MLLDRGQEFLRVGVTTVASGAVFDGFDGDPGIWSSGFGAASLQVVPHLASFVDNRVGRHLMQHRIPILDFGMQVGRLDASPGFGNHFLGDVTFVDPACETISVEAFSGDLLYVEES